MKLTQANVKTVRLPAGKSDTIFFDDDIPGFGLRVRDGGSRAYIVQYKSGAKHRRMTLGSINIRTSKEARDTARDILAAVRLGKDPAGEKVLARSKAAETFKPIAALFLKHQKQQLRPSSYAAADLYLSNHWRPLHGLALDKIERKTIARQLDKITDARGAVSAVRARAALSAFFSWAIRQGLCDANPVIGTNKAKYVPRERNLSKQEIVAVWNALPNSHYGHIVKLLFLTGCRKNEIGLLSRDEVDLEGRLITLPSERTKNHRAHDVPLSGASYDLLADVIARDGCLFGRSANGFSGWSKAKARLDRELPSMEPWHLHDIRRTVATGMADLGVQPHIVEAVLNHVSGHKAGVAGIYNRAAYSKEKTDALNMWANHIEVLLSGADNVRRLESA